MNILQNVIRNLPGLSPQWKRMLSQAWEITRGYQNSRSELLRAIADRNLKLQDLQKGLPYLQSGPVAGVLDSFSPGLSSRLYSLGSDLVKSAGGDAAPPSTAPTAPSAASGETQHRRGNPFPSLKK